MIHRQEPLSLCYQYYCVRSWNQDFMVSTFLWVMTAELEVLLIAQMEWWWLQHIELEAKSTWWFTRALVFIFRLRNSIHKFKDFKDKIQCFISRIPSALWLHVCYLWPPGLSVKPHPCFVPLQLRLPFWPRFMASFFCLKLLCLELLFLVGALWHDFLPLHPVWSSVVGWRSTYHTTNFRSWQSLSTSAQASSPFPFEFHGSSESHSA